MVITQAKPTRRGRLSIYADGEFLFAVEAEAWRQSGLSEGDEADECQLDLLLEQSRRLEAKRRALDMLSRRDYPGDELASRIARKTGLAPAREAVERMRELGLVDDGGYALRLAGQLLEKGYAERRIRYELQKRRLPDEIIEDALGQLDFPEPERRAAELLSAKFGRLETDSDRRRAAALLERWGYGYSDIRSAVRSLSDAEFDDC